MVAVVSFDVVDADSDVVSSVFGAVVDTSLLVAILTVDVNAPEVEEG